MPLSWNEIKSRATAFAAEWKNDVSEDAEAKSFYDDFFHVFGISRRRVATFEQQVRLTPNLSTHGEGSKSKTGFIDLLWKGVILIEHKSRGKDLERAYQQAKDYFPGLKEKELPRYILVSDFANFHLYDLEDGTSQRSALKDFVHQVHLFGFIAGYQKRTYKEQDPVNIEAAELMGKLHDKLKAIGYTGHSLELYLVRLLFLLFADDTNIFERGIFQEYIDQKTAEDGSDLAAHLSQLFYILNTPKEKRLSNLDEALQLFPYVNGKLFEETLPPAHFDSTMRKLLLDSCGLDWGKISPAIFGSLFQSVMDEKARRNLGAHYTSEKNIFKVIKPLFLGDLYTEFEKAKGSTNALQKLHKRLSELRFLDPACGCGNFLIIAYRELRLLEMEIVKLLLKGQTVTDIGYYFLLDVDRFYGIEYEEFPAQIAQVAMWLIDHQMNMKASETFGEYYVRLPLKKSATIVHGNALQTDWQSLIYNTEESSYDMSRRNFLKISPASPGSVDAPQGAEKFFDFILGNPPFIGKSLMNAAQKADMEIIFKGVNGAGVLDYVSAWYLKAAKYMEGANAKGNKTRTAFVSTNSISQGEQVGILWNELFNKHKVKIHFAHRTFSWQNEARGNAAVHVVIIGFANFDIADKVIYEYENIKAEPHEVKAKNINPYLVEGKDSFVVSRRKPICSIPELIYGNKPVDGGNFFLTTEEKLELITNEPAAEKFIKRIYGSQEYINNIERWCIWLLDADPSELRKLPHILKKIEAVKSMRLASPKEATVRLADRATLFAEIRQPHSEYLIIPRVSSERRKYIPIGLLPKEIIVNDLVSIIPNASHYHLGVLSSLIHISWVKHVGGRLKSDIRYSNDIIYNNFPWPEAPTEKQKVAVEAAAQAVLDARAKFPDASLADLYDPNTMPPILVKAHQTLDKAVDQCYRSQPFTTETKRIEFLFELYDKYTSGMFGKEKKK